MCRCTPEVRTPFCGKPGCIPTTALGKPTPTNNVVALTQYLHKEPHALPPPGGFSIVQVGASSWSWTNIAPGPSAEDTARRLFALAEADVNTVFVILYDNDGFLDVHDLS